MLRALVVTVWTLGCVLAPLVAHADTVALLPLDAEKRLEIYGQPVAAEMGRALKANGVDVVVVGAKMDVPDRAQLIVDGSITPAGKPVAGKTAKDSITLTMRIRDPRDGTTLETLPPSTTTLTTIDKAAAELSSKLVPAVKTHLAALAKAAVVTPPPTTSPEHPVEPVAPARPATPQLPAVLVAALAVQTGNPALELLARAVTQELTPWAHAHQHEAQVVDASRLSRAMATSSVGQARAPLGVSLEVLSFSVEPGAVPLAHARVRLRIADATQVLFERILRTDTIVGDRDISEQQLAARTAREVLAITNAQLRRKAQGWR